MAFPIEQYTEPSRVIVYVKVTDIKGDPLRRPNQLGSDFCQQVLSRPFRSQINPEGYDAVHIPGGFDSDQDIRRYFLFDLGVNGPKSQIELASVPHHVFLASRQGDGWKFIHRPSSAEAAAKRTLRYKWGGYNEQQMLAYMKEGALRPQ